MPQASIGSETKTVISLEDSERLFFVTENVVDTAQYSDRSGLALNFTLTNGHKDTVTVYSIKVLVTDFKDASTVEFQTYLIGVPLDQIIFSAPIPVYGIHIVVSGTRPICRTFWGSWEDSAGCRGALFKTDGQDRYKRTFDIVKGFPDFGREFCLGDSELLPSSLRFALASGASDSFYCQVRGEEGGLYQIKFVVGYHLRGIKLVQQSDRSYEFGWVDKSRGSYHLSSLELVQQSDQSYEFGWMERFRRKFEAIWRRRDT